MANESAAGRDGYIVARGQRFYHVYKQDFPMEFWYGLTPDANREDSPGLLDVRTLPEQYRTAPVEIDPHGLTTRNIGKRMRNQRVAHIFAFANAVHDGFDFKAHVEREEEKAEREWAQQQAERKARETENSKNGGCPCCGQAECDIPF